MITSFFSSNNPPLPTTLLGLIFKNPIGLAAGFDKNAAYLNELEAVGFGFIEIGTVTPLPQEGNEKPRLFRLPKDKALINRMGFNNDGAEAIAKRLEQWKTLHPSMKNKEWPKAGLNNSDTHLPFSNSHLRLIIGGNIGKNKITSNENAWKDYEICFTRLHDFVDYFVVNVSSPNTPGLRALQEKEALKKILTNLQSLNSKQPQPKPILLKIAPDLTTEQVDDVIDLAMEIQLDGLVATNTTISREHLQTTNQQIKSIGAGGLSGLPLKKSSTEMVKYIHQKTNGKIPIIGSGGIFSGKDAMEKLHAGASLVQVWTGFIYEGPAIVKKIITALKKIDYTKDKEALKVTHL